MLTMTHNLRDFRERPSGWQDSKKLHHSRLEYEDLPKPIKTMYSEQEYLWLSDGQKVGLIESECLPEWRED